MAEFPKYLQYKDDRTYSVLGYIGEVDGYIDNKGYIDKKTGKIYICSKNEPPFHDDVPVLKVDGDNIEKVEPQFSSISDKFHEDKIYTLSLDHICEATSGNEVLYDEDMLADMNASTSLFIPTINESDDPLKKLIKQAIIDKAIDINRLKHKMPQKYGLTNMKSALIGKTKMSITNFNIWCELLGINYEVILSDNGNDTQDPLKGVIHYDNTTNRITKLSH